MNLCVITWYSNFMEAKNSKMKAICYTLSCILLWAFIPVVSKFGQSTLDNVQFLFWSSALSLVIVFLAAVFAGKISSMKAYSPKRILHALFLGFLGTFLYYLLLYHGYAHAQGLEVLALQYTWPIFIVLFSVVFLKERPNARTIVALILGFLGVLIVLTKGRIKTLEFSNLGADFIVLIAASVFGLFSVLSKKSNNEAYSATVYFFISATVFSAFTMLLTSHFAIPQGMAWLPILVNGALINGLSYVLWLQALKHGKASFVAPFVFLTPVIAALLIALFFQEPLLPAYIFGLVAVVLAGVIAK